MFGYTEGGRDLDPFNFNRTRTRSRVPLFKNDHHEISSHLLSRDGDRGGSVPLTATASRLDRRYINQGGSLFPLDPRPHLGDIASTCPLPLLTILRLKAIPPFMDITGSQTSSTNGTRVIPIAGLPLTAS